ncbi:Hypothetical protein FKW44_018906 [Caligus rogercresseyi]|uniref:Uncharacterized protein n=1 Tax=Caligus rogercresseyi TaxID=217165 RepID=A0A7T8JY29_CALRO|nr:Hypothetical protein FKW44_018906 [Caligus rogercresseyi]
MKTKKGWKRRKIPWTVGGRYALDTWKMTSHSSSTRYKRHYASSLRYTQQPH